MSNKKGGFWIMAISILFAGGLIISSYLNKDSENAQIIFYLIIAAWFIPFQIIKLKMNKTSGNCCHLNAEIDSK